MNAYSTVELRTGRRMPLMGLGTWQLSDNTAGTIEAAIIMGYRMIDTSSDYGTHRAIGEALARSSVSRNSMYLVTKVEEDDDALPAVKKYLGQLQQEYADLILIHRPPHHDAGVELWEGLIEAKHEGLVRDIGVSNYTPELIDELIDETGEVPVVNQIEWSPFGYSEEMRRYARANKIVIQAYSPLTRGRRLGDPILDQMGFKYGKTPAQVLLRWSVESGAVPLPKANQLEHLEENLHIFDFRLSEQEMQQLNRLNEQYSSLGSLAYV